MGKNKIVDKSFKIGRAKLRYFKCGKSNTLLINLGRYKMGKETDTQTLYCSIMEHTEPYTEVWLDTQGKTCIGGQIMWEDEPRREI